VQRHAVTIEIYSFKGKQTKTERPGRKNPLIQERLTSLQILHVQTQNQKHYIAPNEASTNVSQVYGISTAVKQ